MNIYSSKKVQIGADRHKPCFHQSVQFSSVQYGTHFFSIPLSKAVNELSKSKLYHDGLVNFRLRDQPELNRAIKAGDCLSANR